MAIIRSGLRYVGTLEDGMPELNAMRASVGLPSVSHTDALFHPSRQSCADTLDQEQPCAQGIHFQQELVPIRKLHKDGHQ